ncbi:MAG: hypothetical protein HQM08_15420 [Candidatus Riflebacteria bacterium]|nr:hypothetical protein [Candidatus Riflebacteria bacterium]
MSRYSRVLGILVLLLSFFGIWVFSGCGGGGGGRIGDDPTTHGIITGTLYNTYPSIRVKGTASQSAAVLGGVISGEATVYLENDPSIFAQTNNGKFSMTVPFSASPYRVIAVWTDIYSQKRVQRSVQVYVNENKTSAVIPPDDQPDARMDFSQSNSRSRIALKDPTGLAPVSADNITIWGISNLFSSLDAGQGLFESPLVPDNVSTESIIVTQAGYQSLTIPLRFSSTVTSGSTAPPTVETTIVKSGSNKAPLVNLSASKYTITNPGETVTLSGTVTDDQTLPTSNVFLVADFGEIQNFSFNGSAVSGTWKPPVEGNGTATITLIASDSFGLTGKAKVFMSYGFSSSTNQPPVISKITTSASEGAVLLPFTMVSLTADAIDPNGDTPLSYFWTQTGAASGTFSVTNAPSTVWTSSTATGDIYLSVRVADPRGAYSTGLVHFIVSSVAPKAAEPKLRIIFPLNKGIMNKGNTTFSAEAYDSTGNLPLSTQNSSFSWTISSGSTLIKTITGTLSPTYNFALAATYTLSFSATYNGVSSSTSVLFRINENPFVTINYPVDGDVYLASNPISFKSTVTDVEDGIVPDASITWGIVGTTVTASGTFFVGNNLPPDTPSLTGLKVFCLASDSLGAVGGATVTFHINSPPIITAAATNLNVASCTASQTIIFSGAARDDQEGTLVDNSLFGWFDGNTQIGTGTTFATSTFRWFAGNHNIFLKVHDNGIYGAGIAIASQSFIVTVAGDQPPLVAILSPVNNFVATPGSTISFIASATDPEDGSYGPTSQNVQWMEGATSLGKGTLLNTASLGGNATHTITFKAQDASGGIASVSITVGVWNYIPQITAFSPMFSPSYKFGDPVTLSASAVDPEEGPLTANPNFGWYDGPIAPANFIGSGTALTISTFTAKVHNVILIVKDNQAAPYTGIASQTITFTVGSNQAPVVSITAPSPNTVVSPRVNIAFSATATDNEDGTYGPGSSTAGWSEGATFLGSGTLMNIATLSINASHTITFQAKDSAGAVSVTSVLVGVWNSKPSITAYTPLGSPLYPFGSSITLSATANDLEDGDLTTVAPNNFGWYDGPIAPANFIGSGTSLTISTFTAKVHNVILRVMDKEAAPNTGVATQAINFTVNANNLPVVTIASPSTNWVQIFKGAANVTVSGNANDSEDGSIATATSFSWLASTTTGAVASLGTGLSFTINPLNWTVGTHSLTLSVKDSAGGVGVATTTILVNDVPKAFTLMNALATYTYASDTINLFVNATDTFSTAFPTANFSWTIDTNTFAPAAGKNTFSWFPSAGDSDLGTRTIAVAGIDSFANSYNTNKKIYINSVPVTPNINFADNDRFETGLPFNFSAISTDKSPGDSVTFKWYAKRPADANYRLMNTTTSTPSGSDFSTLWASATVGQVGAVMSPGTWTLKVEANDSYGATSFVAKTVLINRLASPTWLSATTSAFSGQYATNSAGLPVYLISAGLTNMNFVASASDYEDDPAGLMNNANFSWEISGPSVSPVSGNGSNNIGPVAISQPGTYTFKIYYTDSYSTVASKSFQFNVWKIDYINGLNMNQARGLKFFGSVPADMYFVNAGSSSLKKSSSPYSSASNITDPSWTNGIVDLTNLGGFFYITDPGNNTIFSIKNDLSATSSWAFNGASAIDTDGAKLLISNNSNPEIDIYDANMNWISTFTDYISSSPTGLSVYNVSNAQQFFVGINNSSSPGSVIKRIDYNNHVIIPGWANSGVASYSFATPVALGANPNAWLAVSDTKNNQIKVLDPTGGLWAKFGPSAPASSGSDSFVNPAGIAFNGNKIFFVDSGKNRIVSVDFGSTF